MKKTLMAGTALVASGVLLAAASGTASAQAKKAEKIKLGLGGYMEQWFGYSDQDLPGYTDVDQKSDSEIYIKGAVTLDNGIRFGVTWEIEGDSAPDAPADPTSNRFDEAYLFMSGSFGRLVMGEEDTASELMGYGPSMVGPVGINKSDANDDWMHNNNSTNITHSMDLGMSDNHAISYYSPRVAGFQFGASYHPTNDNEAQNETLETAAEHNGFSTAVNYVTKFGGTSVAAYFGVATKEESDAATAGTPDASGWGTGVQVGFGGFAVGAAYVSENEIKSTDTFSVGGRYKAGMNAFSLGYVHAENRVSARPAGGPDNDETDIVALGYERTLGPGVTWGSSIAYADHEVGGDDGTTTLDNEGIIIVTGIKLNF